MKPSVYRTFSSLFLIFSFIIFPTSPTSSVAENSTQANDVFAAKGNPDAAGKGSGIGFKRPPLRFERNAGQSDSQVRFMARTDDSLLWLTVSEAVLQLPRLASAPVGKRPLRRNRINDLPAPVESAALRFRPVGGNSNARITGIDKLPGVSNYFIGNDPRKWRTRVESYAAVKYENLYPGIDLIYYSNAAGELEYDFKVAPGANPNLIAMSIEGADRIEVDDPSGDLILTTAVGRVRQHAPLIYQEIDGKRQEIAGHYRFLEAGKTTQNSKSKIQNPLIAFELDDYDESKPLVIDPVVVYSTLLGGAAGNFDGAKGVAVDAQGNAYITGNTESSDFPTRNPLDGTPPQRFGASSKAFVSKFAPDGSLIYSTFLGGNDSSSAGSAIAVDETGNVYVAGSAGSGFPIKDAFQPTLGSTADAFITKLNADGTMIIYSSYLGGNQGESVRDLKLDAQNNVYLLGEIPGRGVANVTFPTVHPTQANYGGGDRDMFLSVVASSGASLLFSTYFGGNGDEEAKSVSVSSDGNKIAIIGASDSTNLSTSRIAPQATDPSCDRLEDILLGLDFELGFGRIETLIVDMRKKLGREPTCAEIIDVFIPSPDQTRIGGMILGSGAFSGSGSGLSNQSSATVKAEGGGFDVGIATFDQNNVFTGRAYFGGSRDEFVADAAIDLHGATYVAGDTTSTDLPTVAPTQAAPGGVNDSGFVVVFAPDTYDVLFATYLGGDGFTFPEGIAVDSQGNIFVSGTVTTGTIFPTTPGAFQRELKGRNDAFLVKYSPVDIPTGPDFSLVFNSSPITTSTGKIKVPATINRTGGFSGNVTITAGSLPDGVTMPAGSAPTTENSVKFKLKVKPNAAPGNHTLTFNARDDAGRERSATLTLIIQ